jgi:hypothetical protein
MILYLSDNHLSGSMTEEASPCYCIPSLPSISSLDAYHALPLRGGVSSPESLGFMDHDVDSNGESYGGGICSRSGGYAELGGDDWDCVRECAS